MRKPATVSSTELFTDLATDHHKSNSTAKPATKFIGTDNPRHLRVITALLVRPRTRKEIDSVAGCSNAPELMAELFRRGLDVVPCRRVPGYDRDGRPVRFGVYSLSDADRRKLNAWMGNRGATK